MLSKHRLVGLLASVLLTVGAGKNMAQAQDAQLRERALATMRKAAEFYRQKVAYRGGYVYYYSPDLSYRHGE
jgi:hypothetical protein